MYVLNVIAFGCAGIVVGAVVTCWITGTPISRLWGK